jgi:hypothetical protein
MNGNPAVKAMAAKLGVSEQEFIDAALKSKKNKTIVDSRAEDALKRIKNLRGKTDEKSKKQYDQAVLDFITTQNLYQDVPALVRAAGGLENYINYYASDKAFDDLSKKEKEIGEKMTSQINMKPGEARIGDQFLASVGAQDQAYLTEVIPLFAKEISNAQQNLYLFSDQIVRLTENLKKIDPKDLDKVDLFYKRFMQMFNFISEPPPQGNRLLFNQQTKGAPEQQ